MNDELPPQKTVPRDRPEVHDDELADHGPRGTSIGTPTGSRRGRVAARRKKVRRRTATALAVFVLLLIGLGVGVRTWYTSQLGAWGDTHTKVEVEIAQGSSTARIGEVLASAKVVRNARVFAWEVRSKGAGPFEAGRYEFRSHGSVNDAVATLEQGPLGPRIVRVNIPEGFRVSQILERIHRDVPRITTDELQKVIDARQVDAPFLPGDSKNYEGTLFPATYDVTEDQDARAVLQAMADAMRSRTADLDIEAGAKARGLTPYQILIVASLIQSEAGNVDEAPKIARVIYNRLDEGTPLGIDATSRYLSIITGDDVDFSSPSPFNTRLHPGLPPTPISAPGEFAIRAALHPADGPWTWYVLDVAKDPQGRPQHVFTDSAAEFDRAKLACYEAGLGCGKP